MKIDNLQLTMTGSHSYREEHLKEEALRLWRGDSRPDFQAEQPDPSENQLATVADQVSFSEEAIRRRFQRSSSAQPAGVNKTGQTAEDPRLITMRLILEALTGKRIKIFSFDRQESSSSPAPASTAGERGDQPQEPQRAGWGLEYDYRESYAEHEQMSFSAQGQVQTTDGQQFSFAIQLAASRGIAQNIDFHLRAGDALLVDPLVVNLNGQSVGLSGLTVDFDLNSDGTSEKIPFLNPGSGFLFLDRNNDGQATNGSELFGPTNGNGFAELSALDGDQNGWLDDNDPLFKKLKVWTRDAAGTDYFTALRDRNIGAILLNHQGTPFTLSAPDNKQSGQITGTGVFLRENGNAGTIQEIDLSV